MPSLRILASGGLLLVALGLTIVNARQHREDPGLPFVAACGLLLLLWVPTWLQTICMACFLGLAVGAINLLAGLVVGALVWALGAWIPGGGGVLLLAGLTIAAPLVVHAAFARLRRMRDARALVPGERPRGDVELHGRVRMRTPVPPPPERPDLRAPLWELKCPDHTIASKGLVEIVTTQGLALLDPVGARMELNAHVESVKTDVARLMLLALDVPPEKLGKDLSGTLRWIEDGTDVYVVGIPTWETAASLADGYRDAPTVPVFRARKDASVLVVDRTEAAVHADAVGGIWAWSAWGVVFPALLVLQMWRGW